MLYGNNGAASRTPMLRTMLRTATTNHSPKAAVGAIAEIDYAIDKQEELRQLDQYLEQLNYNEQDHAFNRSEVERWRWQKRQQIKDAQRRQPLFWHGNPK